MITGVKWLKNHGVLVTTLDGRNQKKGERFVRAGGELPIYEAAVLLGTNPMKLYRLMKAKKIRTRNVKGVRMMSLKEAWRIRSWPSILEDRRRKEAA